MVRFLLLLEAYRRTGRRELRHILLGTVNDGRGRVVLSPTIYQNHDSTTSAVVKPDTESRDQRGRTQDARSLIRSHRRIAAAALPVRDGHRGIVQSVLPLSSGVI